TRGETRTFFTVKVVRTRCVLGAASRWLLTAAWPEAAAYMRGRVEASCPVRTCRCTPAARAGTIVTRTTPELPVLACDGTPAAPSAASATGTFGTAAPLAAITRIRTVAAVATVRFRGQRASMRYGPW